MRIDKPRSLMDESLADEALVDESPMDEDEDRGILMVKKRLASEASGEAGNRDGRDGLSKALKDVAGRRYPPRTIRRRPPRNYRESPVSYLSVVNAKRPYHLNSGLSG